MRRRRLLADEQRGRVRTPEIPTPRGVERPAYVALHGAGVLDDTAGDAPCVALGPELHVGAQQVGRRRRVRVPERRGVAVEVADVLDVCGLEEVLAARCEA